jgi:hypothetical protein
LLNVSLSPQKADIRLRRNIGRFGPITTFCIAEIQRAYDPLDVVGDAVCLGFARCSYTPRLITGIEDRHADILGQPRKERPAHRNVDLHEICPGASPSYSGAVSTVISGTCNFWSSGSHEFRDACQLRTLKASNVRPPITDTKRADWRGRKGPQSLIFFCTMAATNKAGKAALKQLLGKLKA